MAGQIQCRECKHQIIKAIGLSIIQNGRFWLQGNEVIYVAGCFGSETESLPWKIIPGAHNIPEQDMHYSSNASDADLRLWRHAKQSTASEVLIYSPDTDIYNIGLLVSQHQTKNVSIQINPLNAQLKTYISINNLITALQNDPDLSSLPTENIPKIMVSLFVSTGSDYTSYFKSIGKASFLNCFFHHSSFITGKEAEGSLGDFEQNSRDLGFLAFLRLVGTAYFKKHLSSFISLYESETPRQLYNSIDSSLPAKERHKLWIETIGKTVGEHITSEDQCVPSVTSLWRGMLQNLDWTGLDWNHTGIFKSISQMIINKISLIIIINNGIVMRALIRVS